MDNNNMTTLNHLSDDELSDELHRRLEHLVALVEELDENMHRLAVKYHIEKDDLLYCDLTEQE